ncbi:hypothetical protein RJ641_009811 [Dillenia turbinata]|uniref:Aldehyde dehydrogenase domain-containing protein n=1 Tax=Dillenia turbinata TaxID=194707 RepID=A0AAN8Z7P6_9MAGN
MKRIRFIPPYTELDDDVATCFEYYADLMEALDKKQKTPLLLPMETFKCYVLKEPIGVVALVTPCKSIIHMFKTMFVYEWMDIWSINYLLLMATWKVAPALTVGCVAILKPFELASMFGAPLVAHPNVDKIAFTKSGTIGSKIMQAATQWVKECIAKEFLEKLVKSYKNVKILDHFEDGCRLDPVVCGGQLELF